MLNGTVKWFDATKGYGFIIPEEPGADVFVHISSLKKCGMEYLSEGDKIKYEIGEGRNGKMQAVTVELEEESF